MKILILITLVPFISLLVFILWACQGSSFGRKHKDLIVNDHINRPTAESGSAIEKVNILSWNIAWGYGIGSEGSHYIPKNRESFVQALDSMAQTIKGANADIVFLQEVDFSSSKSHGIDQLDYLAKKLGMNRAYAVSWDLNYLPFPYWPFKNHFGKVCSGGGILSRFPIESNKVLLWDKPKANAWWYNIFYLFRYSQVAKVEINGQSYELVNSHLEAFDKVNRAKQAQKAIELISKDSTLVFGGDLNTTPPIAKRKSNFSDVRDNYEEDSTYEIVSASGFLKDSLSLDQYGKDEKRYFSFPSVGANRKLDYLFIKKDLEGGEFKVIQTPVSDHLPVAVEVFL